jgi:ribonuclease Z
MTIVVDLFERQKLYLPGFLLTLADASSRKIDVIGPQGLTHFLAATRKYIYRYCYPFVIGI